MKKENYSTPEFEILEICPETDSCASMGGAAETYDTEQYNWDN